MGRALDDSAAIGSDIALEVLAKGGGEDLGRDDCSWIAGAPLSPCVGLPQLRMYGIFRYSFSALCDGRLVF